MPRATLIKRERFTAEARLRQTNLPSQLTCSDGPFRTVSSVAPCH